MKVYLVWYSYPYENTDEVRKIFDTEEKAKAYIKNQYEEDQQDLYVYEYEVE
jgi:hypothetical protein